jgi:hypothetical protein
LVDAVEIWELLYAITHDARTNTFRTLHLEFSKVIAIRRLAVAVALIALASGCSVTKSDETSPNPRPSGFAYTIEALYNEAISAGASEGQLVLLRNAESIGRVPLAFVEEAVDDAIECFDINGVAHTELTWEPDASGLLHPMYLFGSVAGLDSDESYAVAMECISTYSDFL